VANLSPREQQVARYLSLGKQDREIAELLHTSVGTIKNHGVHIRDKLGVGNRLGIALWWIHEGSKLYPAETLLK